MRSYLHNLHSLSARSAVRGLSGQRAWRAWRTAGNPPLPMNRGWGPRKNRRNKLPGNAGGDGGPAVHALTLAMPAHQDRATRRRKLDPPDFQRFRWLNRGFG